MNTEDQDPPRDWQDIVVIAACVIATLALAVITMWGRA